MPRYKVMVAVFAGGGIVTHHMPPWLVETMIKMRDDPRIGPGNVELWQLAEVPIDMGRNRALDIAEQEGFDYCLMLDNDMRFDLPYPDAKPFWSEAFNFAVNHEGPCVIAAPYCGPPPNENVYVFRFESTQTDDPNPNFKLLPYSRHEAAQLTGIQQCGALPTGLMLIDMRAVKKLPHPRFYYEWTDEKHTHKASTEDVTFSRDLAYVGVPLYCAWDSWAGHIKTKMVAKPQIIPSDLVPGWMVERSLEGPCSDEKLAAWKEKPRDSYLLSPKPEMMQRGTASRSYLK